MCRICKKDDGKIICNECFEDEAIQAAIQWHLKRKRRKEKLRELLV